MPDPVAAFESAQAPDLHVDGLDLGHLLLRGELVCDRPARGARDEAHGPLLVEAIEFVDHAVDVVGQRVALGADATVVGDQPLEAACGAHLGADRQTQEGETLQHLRVRGRQVEAFVRA